MLFNGYKLVAVPDEIFPNGTYVQVRRHRKKRMNKKYLKKYGTRYQAPLKFYMFNEKICYSMSRRKAILRMFKDNI